MNGINRIVVDTNIAIYYLSGNPATEKYFQEFSPIISFITELELLSGLHFQKDEIEIIKHFLKDQTVITYLTDLKDIILNIRSEKKLKLPDAIIAATAIYFNIPLVSADKAFNSVKGLDFIYYEPVY